MALGEPYGRNLASALMRSRVHNRTRDRDGKPIQLAWPWVFPLVGPEGPGALSKVQALASLLLAGRWRCRGPHLQGPRDAGQRLSSQNPLIILRNSRA
jgi:hypothetical protein